MPSAGDYLTAFNNRHSKKKKRINWNRRIKEEKKLVLKEAVERLRDIIRDDNVPYPYIRGYYSAITVIEILMEEVSASTRQSKANEREPSQT